MTLRITSWNVNGIRNPFAYQPWREKRTFQAMFDILEADIVVMQETKIQRKDLKDDMVLVPGWDVFFSLPKHKKGYSGVAIYTRNSTCCPIRVEEGIAGVLSPPNSSTRFRDLPEERRIGGYPRPGQLSSDVDELTLDSEGRCVIVEFPAFVLIGTYSPANRDETRVEFRQSFLEALDVRVRNLVAAGKQVILTGDLNVIRSGLDTSNLAESLRKEGMTMDDWMRMPARRLFNQLVFEGHVVGERDEGREQPVLWDLGRRFHPSREGMFTCWDTKRNTRPANNGSRIDYILCSSGIKEWFQDSDIQEGLMGSDHCPVFATLKDKVNFRGQETSLLDLMNPEGMMRDGKRVREWSLKDLLPVSARLIPEFDRRQSIRDMFMKKPASKPPASTPATKPTGHPAQATESTCHPPIEDAVHDKDKGSSPQPPKSTPLLTLDASGDSTGDPPPWPATHDSPPNSIANLNNKRTAEEAPSPKRTLKKTKTNESELSGAKGNSGLAQSTLKGFFRPKLPSTSNIPAQIQTKEPSDSATPSPQKPQSSDFEAREPAPNGLLSPNKSLPLSSSTSSLSAVDGSEKVFDPIQVKESWSKLRLGQRVAPKCEHGEPCISLLTKKPGVNCGRSFYICPRPLGPSGEKETGTEWRCGTFIWSSDWKKDRS